jgi:3-deoxy-D-manno-octulosonate 8-phosphate phosphatase (KDO 8-P phosphatase)
MPAWSARSTFTICCAPAWCSTRGFVNGVSMLPEFSAALLGRAARVRLVCFDIDGVLTDGGLIYGPQGEALKAFHVHDGLGLKLVMQAGIEVAIVTARDSAIVAARMRDLGVDRVHQGERDKLARVRAIAQSLSLDLDQVAYVGDDLPDLSAMKAVGLAIAVANARAPIAAIAHWRTTAHGGRGAARDVCELLLHAQGKLEAAIAAFDRA